MPITGPGDVYFGFRDDAISKMIACARSQRPSIFNYSTPYFAQHPELWCINVPPPSNGAPTFTPMPAITHYPIQEVPPIEYVMQLSDVGVGFGVDNIGLPASLTPLAPQHAALGVKCCIRVQVPRLDPNTVGPPGPNQFSQAIFVPQLTSCFEIELFATLTSSFRSSGETYWLAFMVDEFDENIVSPGGLHQLVEEYVLLILDTKVLPAAWPQITPFILDLTNSLPPSVPVKTITIHLSPTQTNPNPAIANDVLSARFDVKVTAP